MNTVFFIRHGENPANVTGEFSYRRVDYGLNERGRAQATRAAHCLRDERIEAIYTSPLRRARDTADLIAESTGAGVHVIEEFREVNVGDLEDGPPTPEKWQLHDQILDHWRAGNTAAAFPGGEDYPTLLNRITRGWERILAGRKGKRIAVVGHAGMFGCTFHEFCPEFTRDDARLRAISNCSVTRLRMEWDRQVRASVDAWCECAHLKDL